MKWLERQWQRYTLWTALLYAPSLVFRCVVSVRRALYSRTLLKRERMPVPVIVVGNITVGGTGKTPLVVWLASFLTARGMRPGIVSRGYGSRAREPRAVTRESDPAGVGDEAVLLAQRGACPVWIGADRAAACGSLLRAHPECNVILSDDGLQHYGLARDIELAVVDGARGLGNGLMLPAGPLREPALRLREVDAVVMNGAGDAPAEVRALRMLVDGREFHNLLNPGRTVGPDYFQRKRVHAVAGIGHPGRFFAHLQRLGIEFEGHAYPDHHAYVARDLAFPAADAVLMTEKDAVKCAAFALETHWVLRVDAVPDVELGELVMRKLRLRSP